MGSMNFATDMIYSMDNDKLMSLWNEYCNKNGRKDSIHYNTSESVNKILSSLTPYETVLLGQDSYSYDESDEFVQYKKNENELYSEDEVRHLIDYYDNEDFLQIILDNASDDELIEGFVEYFLENTSLEDDDDLSLPYIEYHLRKLYKDFYKSLKSEDWMNITKQIDKMISESR